MTVFFQKPSEWAEAIMRSSSVLEEQCSFTDKRHTDRKVNSDGRVRVHCFPLYCVVALVTSLWLSMGWPVEEAERGEESGCALRKEETEYER